MPGNTYRTVVHIIRAATYGGLCGIPHNPPNRTCGFPASGSPVGSRISHTERQFGAAFAGPALSTMHYSAPWKGALSWWVRKPPSNCRSGW